MNKGKILIVEDDAEIAELIALHLNNSGYITEHSASYRDGYTKALSEEYSLIILDMMLPGGDGIDICREIRRRGDQIPIIVLTAKSEETDKVIGLELGADDYITKPFSIREFLARVKVVLRRAPAQVLKQEDQVYEFDKLQINALKRKVTLDGDSIDLTKKEFDLLLLLAKNSGISYSREKLLDLVWGYQFKGYEHTVNSHINRLRAKIEPKPSKPKYILTAWGVGYKFNDDLK